MKIQGSKLVQGLGFGGIPSEFRLYINPDDIEHGSYVKPQDKTYEIGYIGPRNGELKIH